MSSLISFLLHIQHLYWLMLNTSKLWHEIFEHLNFKYLQQHHNGKIFEGFPLIQTSDGVCLGCLVGKHPEKRYEVGKEHRVVFILDLIHSDVSRPMPTTSNNGSRYFLTFIDDCSRFCWVYFMKQKSELFEILKFLKPWLKIVLERRSIPLDQIMEVNTLKYILSITVN